MASKSRPTIKVFRNTWLVLMALLVLTVLAAHFKLGAIALVIALIIATAKALLILLVFMEVHYHPKIIAVFAVAAYLWLGILIVGTLHDYLSRNWLPRPPSNAATLGAGK